MSEDRHPLQSLVSDAASKLGRIREDLEKIRGSLRKIRETLEAGFEDLHDAIYANIEAQAELKLMERLAEVKSLPPQIRAEHERINQEHEEMEEKLGTVSERYERKHEELNRKAAERVRDVGEHIFEILEDEFEDSIEAPLVEGVSPTWQEMQDHTLSVAIGRQERLHDEFDRASESIDQFLDHRGSLLSDIESHRVPEDRMQVSAPTTLAVPYWVVTVERNGNDERRIVGPSHLEEDGNGWCRACLAAIDGFDEPLKEAEPRSGGDRPLAVDRAALVAATEPYDVQRLGGSLGFADELERAIPADPEIRVERGF